MSAVATVVHSCNDDIKHSKRLFLSHITVWCWLMTQRGSAARSHSGILVSPGFCLCLHCVPESPSLKQCIGEVLKGQTWKRPRRFYPHFLDQHSIIRPCPISREAGNRVQGVSKKVLKEKTGLGEYITPCPALWTP